jgi:hypothetical protein
LTQGQALAFPSGAQSVFVGHARLTQPIPTIVAELVTEGPVVVELTRHNALNRAHWPHISRPP